MRAKKLILTSIIAAQVLTATALAAPDEAIKEFKKAPAIKQEVKHFQGEVKLFIIKDGEKVRVDQKMTDGLRVVNGRTCVGVRDLVNAIEGAKVEWDGTNHIVDITYAGKTISYPVGKPLMWADGKAVTIDVPAQIDPAISKTFLPIRNIAETLGFKVDWDNKAKEVVLTPGAGTGVTTATAQQPRPTTSQSPKPTTQTPTQNKNGKFVLASGQALPDFNNPPNEATYKLSEADFVDNGDGTETFAKGTPWEATLPKQYKRVESSPAHLDFKIVGNNGPDDRIGTYVFGQGEEEWEKAWKAYYDSFIKDGFGEDSVYLNREKNIKKSPSYVFSFKKEFLNKIDKYLKPRKIKDEYVNEFKKKARFFDVYAKEIKENNFSTEDTFYDATGLIDPSFETFNYESGLDYSPNFLMGLGNCTYILTTDNRLYDTVNMESNYTIDKLVIKYNNKKWLIIDLPNIEFKTKRLYKNENQWAGAIVSNMDYELFMKSE